MTNIVISGRKIAAEALSRKWPGAVVACKRQGADTLIEWDETAVPAKTEAEINTAQDEHEAALTAPPSIISYEAFQNRFTPAEFNAATDFVYESDLVTGKPKRRALIQGLSRAMAKNSVDLLDARTVAFMDALATGGIITAARKTEILTP